MKEATGELNMTVITVVAIAAVGLLFTLFVWPNIQSNLAIQTACANLDAKTTSGKIKGELMFMVGSRKGAAELCLIRWDAEAKAYVSQQIEAGPGPSNLALLNAASGDYLLSANRMIFEAAAYRF